jgi:hypothetical protein
MKLNAFWLAVWRFGRVSIAGVASYYIAKYGHSDWYLTLTPALIAISKWLREKYQVDILVV